MENINGISVNGQVINKESIVWLEGDLNYTRIHQCDQPAKLSSYTLKTYEQQLNGFIRVRKNAIVNPVYIEKMHATADRPRRLLVILTNGDQIEVARRRQPFARRQLRGYQQLKKA